MAYAVSEVFQWTASLELKPRRAAGFYATIGAATFIGLLLNFVHLNPIKALFLSAVLNGVVAGLRDGIHDDAGAEPQSDG